MEGVNNNTPKEENNGKPMTLQQMKDKISGKLTQEKNKAFEQKFTAAFKEYDDAMAIVKQKEKKLEQLFVEHNEGL